MQMAMADNAIQGMLLTCVVTYLRFSFEILVTMVTVITTLNVVWKCPSIFSFQGSGIASERSLNKKYLIFFTLKYGLPVLALQL